VVVVVPSLTQFATVEVVATQETEASEFIVNLNPDVHLPHKEVLEGI